MAAVTPHPPRASVRRQLVCLLLSVALIGIGADLLLAMLPETADHLTSLLLGKYALGAATALVGAHLRRLLHRAEAACLEDLYDPQD